MINIRLYLKNTALSEMKQNITQITYFVEKNYLQKLISGSIFLTGDAQPM